MIPIPYNVDRPARRTPYITYSLMALNTVIFIFTILISNLDLGADQIAGQQAIDTLFSQHRPEVAAEIRKLVREQPGETAPDDAEISEVIQGLTPKQRRLLAARIAFSHADDASG